MNLTSSYEKYPSRIILLSNLLSLSIYSAGLFILYQAGIVFFSIYLLYILMMEFRIIRFHCINCYYWGKSCGFGKGRISALLFKQGKAEQFCKKDMQWKDVIPDLLISLVPLIAGIIILIREFQFSVLAALIVLVFLTTSGNSYIRGKLTCKYCKQREIGCPADKLFNKKEIHDA
jgi:hypothetical protein